MHIPLPKLLSELSIEPYSVGVVVAQAVCGDRSDPAANAHAVRAETASELSCFICIVLYVG